MSATPTAIDRRHVESYVWPLASLALVIVPQVAIPAALRMGPPLPVPLAELILLLVLVLIAVRPGPVPRGARPLILVLSGLLVVANLTAAVHLVYVVLGNEPVDDAPPSVQRLLVSAGLVLATNIVTFALVYWQIDGGGPRRRDDPGPLPPDFEFPQTSRAVEGSGEEQWRSPVGWRPTFLDHLYLAYTNVVAFSPTDALPLTHRAKGLMAAQSVVSLAVLVVVLSRVINILPS